MPKSISHTRVGSSSFTRDGAPSPLSPRFMPYNRTSNALKSPLHGGSHNHSAGDVDSDSEDEDSHGSFDRPDKHDIVARDFGSLPADDLPKVKPVLATPLKHLAISSEQVNSPSYWSLKGDFIRDGIHVYSKSGKHPIDEPLASSLPKPPRWLQVQLNVVVLEESYWTCELILKNMGGLLCTRETLLAVQSGGVGVLRRRGKFTIHLKPPVDEDGDPRIAISYFIPYDEKLYLQAMDGSLPYGFLLQRVSGKAEEKAKRRENRWWRK